MFRKQWFLEDAPYMASLFFLFWLMLSALSAQLSIDRLLAAVKEPCIEGSHVWAWCSAAARSSRGQEKETPAENEGGKEAPIAPQSCCKRAAWGAHEIRCRVGNFDTGSCCGWIAHISRIIQRSRQCCALCSESWFFRYGSGFERRLGYHFSMHSDCVAGCHCFWLGGRCELSASMCFLEPCEKREAKWERLSEKTSKQTGNHGPLIAGDDS